MTLIAHFRLNGNANDSVGTYTGTSKTGNTWVNGVESGALNCPTTIGTDNGGISTDLNSNIIGLIFRNRGTNPGGAWRRMITQCNGDTNGFQIRPYAGNNYLSFKIASSEDILTSMILDDNWKQFAFVKNGSNYTDYYMNGKKMGTKTGFWTTIGNLAIGNLCALNSSLGGKLDNVQVFGGSTLINETYIKNQHYFTKGFI